MCATVAKTLPEKCQLCPVRTQGAPFCWKDLYERMVSLGQVSHVRRLRRGDVLYRQGDEATGWWIVRQGRVVEFIVDEAGREHIVRIAAAGGIAGICGFGPWSEHWATARAGHTGAEVCYVGRDEALRLVSEDPELGRCLLAGMAEELRRAYLRLHGLVTVPARVSAARLLLSMAERTPDGRYVVALSRREMANIIGVRLETAVRILGEFRRQGLIRDEGHFRIELLDPCRLHGVAEGIEGEGGPSFLA
ncbi:hypothetical protein caldi_27850 [Caldinitratiruptor microaerophilus]|uniref:Crp/Fnr family transcriptional regulator n=1 Tax=Caldinitratiruptor microaerophilus TaxID=671077 RepID=A0AA35CLT6_9FIRM|nr:hypothetical protein caldi_27850 [Caldinitratiruptor microaerophilus]